MAKIGKLKGWGMENNIFHLYPINILFLSITYHFFWIFGLETTKISTFQGALVKVVKIGFSDVDKVSVITIGGKPSIQFYLV